MKKITFYEITKNMFSHKSWINYFLYSKVKYSESTIHAYQDICRIYLDEYTEQKELRKNWFGKNHDIFKHIYTRFLKRN
jgi:hypothetical protein